MEALVPRRHISLNGNTMDTAKKSLEGPDYSIDLT
jgi:hypothetical protein